jgi:hypothetical protein
MRKLITVLVWGAVLMSWLMRWSDERGDSQSVDEMYMVIPEAYLQCNGSLMYKSKYCNQLCYNSAIQGVLKIPEFIEKFEISSSYSCHICPNPNQKGDAIWKFIEEYQQNNSLPWGKVLDAGTGVSSFKWLSTLKTEEIVGITASTYIKDRIEELDIIRTQDSLIIGDWTKPQSLSHIKNKVKLIANNEYFSL